MPENTESENDPQKAANLARIRDNQRRSRARRKDYLKDLESKYRNCEQIGVSASAEIQAAARSVVDENRRLRDLLKSYGIPDAEIDRASGNQGSLAGDTLEIMVNSRQPCGQGDGCQSGSTLEVPAPQLQHAQSAPPQSGCRPIACQRPALEIPANATAQSSSQMPTPSSVPGYDQPFDMESSASSQPTPQQTAQMYGMPAGHSMGFPQGFNQPIMNHPMPQQDPQYGGLSSCQVAADTIRTFSPNAGYELEQELGCHAPGEECSVPNLKVFNVIDRYTVGAG